MRMIESLQQWGILRIPASRDTLAEEVPAKKSRVYQSNILGRTLTFVSLSPHVMPCHSFLWLGGLYSKVEILSQLCLALECADRLDTAWNVSTLN